MQRIKVFTVLGWAVFFSMAQTVRINGTVKDSATGLPIQGAAVMLLQNHVSGKTDNAGAFSLSKNSVSVNVFTDAVDYLKPVLAVHGAIFFNLSEKEKVTINMYSIQGKLLHALQGEWQEGAHCVLIHRFTSGVHLYRIALGTTWYSLKSVDMGARPRYFQRRAEASLHALSAAKQTAMFRDTVLVSAAGYYQHLVPIADPVLSGLEIQCRKYADSIIDIEGNVYHTITINYQTWMVENLKTTRYNDSSAIPFVTDSAVWDNLVTHGYCWYDNDEATHKSVYGALYNWYAVNTGKLAPKGWHVPMDVEWSAMITYLGGTNVAGGKLKEAGTAHWNAPNGGATNASGFSALPGGARYDNGTYANRGRLGFWWSSDTTAPWTRSMDCMYEVVNRSVTNERNLGLSVRCVRD